ncbi:MAG TPA: hypothetical protein DCQ34_03565 [Chitinophagaceae bacterium]|nr:hypothetical protein [Chitinophagaceae bacterium]HCY89295.1 hypothetical protein [Chitinophagaceae bacterium]HRF27370.1 SPOR domain-containing protein [Ferruginibacter sp.]
MKNLLTILFLFGAAALKAQAVSQDTLVKGYATIQKDSRIDVLGKKMAEYNENLSSKLKMVKGYRLMLLSTNDRAQAMQVRSQLLQQYPEHKVYMVFQTPYIKLKMGNFTDKSEAEKLRKALLKSEIVSGNIYLLPEMVESRQDKPALTEE